MKRWVWRVLCGALLCSLTLVLVPGTASAHPLGNFTVNHYDRFTFHADHLELTAVLDSAEIPTLQQRSVVDTDRDGAFSPAETEAAADRQCAELGAAVTATVDGKRLVWSARSRRLEFPPGQAGLETTRLTCQFTADAELGVGATVSISDDYLPEKIGWREMTAIGDGVALVDSALPTDSISDELRSYPDDLLGNPLDVREATVRTEPGSGGGTNIDPSGDAGPLDRVVGQATTAFTGLVGTKDLTPTVGMLALLLSLLLGASHALLPGHGKTLIAAYLAGRRGSIRDALTVGATVTVTHTAGVLVLGLLISGSSALAGEGVLRWLGVVSGLLVTGIGVWLIRTALRERRAQTVPHHEHRAEPALVGAVAGGHAHQHGHSHQHVHPESHGHGHGHGHGHAHGHSHSPRSGRGGLIGMGVAGGLVPSPSALVVLLGAVALGRTWFGVLLVIGYGLGMAGTLTVVGLLLVRLRDRLERADRFAGMADRVGKLRGLLPLVTASLVLIVGFGLTLRAATGKG